MQSYRSEIWPRGTPLGGGRRKHRSGYDSESDDDWLGKSERERGRERREREQVSQIKREVEQEERDKQRAQLRRDLEEKSKAKASKLEPKLTETQTREAPGENLGPACLQNSLFHIPSKLQRLPKNQSLKASNDAAF